MLKSNNFSQSRRVLWDKVISIILVGDCIMILCGLFLGFWLRFKSGFIPFGIGRNNGEDDGPISFDTYFKVILLGAVVLFVTYLQLGIYSHRNLLRLGRSVIIIFRGAVLWLIAYLSISFVLGFNPPVSRIYVGCSFFSACAILIGWRFAYHKFLQRSEIASQLRQRVVFFGWSDEAERLAALITKDSSQPYKVVGIIPKRDGLAKHLRDWPQVFNCEEEEFADLLKSQSIDIVIIADPRDVSDSIINIASICERELVQFKIIPSFFQVLISGLELETISSVPILGLTALPIERISSRIVKRCVDIFGACVGLVVAVPIVVIFGAIIFLQSPGPIFYRQIRTGRQGKGFCIIKLRSMKLDAEIAGPQWAKMNDDRRLPIGKFLRAWNLDEVPQFWNVLRGEMSLVGPRPERPELIEEFRYTIPHYNARLISKPGITGWAQVNGLRGDTDLKERVRYDLFYLENWSVMFDFQIMVQTFFSRRNAY